MNIFGMGLNFLLLIKIDYRQIYEKRTSYSDQG